MSKNSSSHALAFLQGMGIKVLLNTLVAGYEDNKVMLKDGGVILSETLIWVSGVVAEHIENIPSDLIGKGGRMMVNEFNQFNQLPGYGNIFSIGGICLQKEDIYPNGHPQVAPVAIQQGRLLAENLKRKERGKAMKVFHYNNQGTLATVGRNKAVADLHKVKLSGFPAWVVWMLVDLRSILGVKNKLLVLIDWIWNYFTYDQSMRFILFARGGRSKEVISKSIHKA